MDERLWELFRVLYAYIYSRAKGKASFDQVARIAQTMLDKMSGQVPAVTWEVAQRRSVHELKRRSALYTPSRVVAFITEMREPQLVVVPGDDGEMESVEATCARIQGRQQESIWLLDVVGAELIDKVDRAYRSGSPIEVLGIPIALPIDIDPKRPDAGIAYEPRNFFYHVHDLRETSTALDLIGATDQERKIVDDKLTAMRDGGLAPLDVLRDLVIERLQIAGTDEFPLLRQLIEFVVLQALSTGAIGHASGRLHMILVGPPAQGKKLIGLGARALNPCYSELSAAKATAAGLVGASYATGTGWKSQPGALARAAHGVAVIQDAHGWRAGDLVKIGPILQEVIEDGVVRDTAAGGVIRDAPVGLVIDLNRTSHVGTSGGHANEAPILRLRPLLSRIDLIAEIPADPDRAWAVAALMYDKLSTTASGPLERQPWVREAQVLVAALRDRHSAVDLEPVKRLMKELHNEIWETNRARFEHMPEAGDIASRLVISLARLITAYARGADRSVATEADVHRAVVFVNMKLEYLSLHGANVPKSVHTSGQAGRQDWVSRNAQEPVRPNDLARRYQQETGDFVCEKTIRRDLADLGAQKVAPGMYLLPPGEPGKAA